MWQIPMIQPQNQTHTIFHQIGQGQPVGILTRLLFIVALSTLFGCTSSSSTPTLTPPAAIESPASRTEFPTLDDYWEGNARFELEISDTGLPMGESDSVILPDGTWRSYVHASHQSLGVLDQCGAPVEFPGCLVTFTSIDAGRTFNPTVRDDGIPICQIPCTRCPCDSRRDHIDQQQYPRVAQLADNSSNNLASQDGTGQNSDQESQQKSQWLLTYEYRANTILRHSTDGLTWSSPIEVPLTGIWRDWLMPCSAEAAIGTHPYAPSSYDCLVGSPPGIYIDADATPPQLYLFVGLGQNPSGLGCLRGPVSGPTSLMRACDHNPLFVGADEYGPLDEGEGDIAPAQANAFFDFRTISSADLVSVGERHYLFYEGVRGPGAGDQGDTQFLLGLARSKTAAIDGAWELYPANPILLDLPGNVGVGHADVVIAEGETFLYTSLDGEIRSRLRLVWN